MRLLRLLLALCFLMHSSIALSGMRVCTAQTANGLGKFRFGDVSFNATRCYTLTFTDERKRPIKGVGCITNRFIFFTFNDGDDWHCSPDQRYSYWNCRGIGDVSLNKNLFLRCS